VKNDTLVLALHVEGFGPKKKGDDLLSGRDRTVNFSLNEELETALFRPGSNYTRKPDEIPEEQGVLKPGSPGLTPPRCIDCPPPNYSDAARAAKFAGTVILSIVVTSEGQATSIYVVKGAPFGLTAAAIQSVRRWRFEPGRISGKPVSVRLQAESTFRLF